MESYQKIFAEELNKGRTDAQNNGIRALSGRNITRCLLCGALTEVPDLEKPMAFLSLYDPTGVLVVGCHTGNPEISALLRETAFPVFVLCTAEIRFMAGNCMPVVESMVPVSRAVRDTFVAAAAEDLVDYIEESPAINPELRKRLCDMAEKALLTVKPEEPAPVVPDDAVILQVETEIREISDEKNTVAIVELIVALENKGVSPDTTRAALKAMINDGDCYQPKPDLIRLL